MGGQRVHGGTHWDAPPPPLPQPYAQPYKHPAQDVPCAGGAWNGRHTPRGDATAPQVPPYPPGSLTQLLKQLWVVLAPRRQVLLHASRWGWGRMP